MRHFPTMCIDGFYKNPDAIREFALAQDFCITSDQWPGRRTNLLHHIDRNFFDSFCEKLFSIYYDFKTETNWEVLTTFQLVPPYSSDEHSVKNLGFIHKDDYNIGQSSVVYAGIIYLTPNINRNCGTSIFRSKEGSIFNEPEYIKENFYGKSDATGLDDYMKKSREHFEETIRFDNIYNRLVSFDSTSYHGVNSFYSPNETRLTQAFFVAKIEHDSGHPLDRSDRRNSL